MKNKCTDVIDRDKETSPFKIWERDMSKSKIEASGL